MSRIAALLQKDLRVVYRDGFMLMLFFYPIALALLARVAVPWVPIEHFDLYLAPGVLLVGGPLFGTVLGFALIEEREQQTWLLLRVLPISQWALLGYLVTVSGGVSLVMIALSALLYGLPVHDPLGFTLMTVPTALTTPLLMLALGAATENKVEGLAISKILSSVCFVPALVFVLPVPWQVLLWWNPMYWIYLGLLATYGGSADMADLALYWPGYPFAAYVVAPLLLSAAGILALARVYRRRAQ